jgi:hypothetical protein
LEGVLRIEGGLINGIPPPHPLFLPKFNPGSEEGKNGEEE